MNVELSRLPRRLDVPVRPKHVLWVPLRFDLGQASEAFADGGFDALGAFVLGEEVDVGAAGREGLEVVPCVARPGDVRFVVGGLVPGAADVEDVTRVAVGY